MIEPNRIKKISKKFTDKNMKFRTFLKNKADIDELDQQFLELHNQIFVEDEYDCCKCANCCKLYDTFIEPEDIPAIANYLGQTESDFIEMYLDEDEEEGGFIIRDIPCTFLGDDNKCRIYDVRPLVCRDFPHTNKPERLLSLLGIMEAAKDCPVVFEIIEQLKKIYKFK